jgi:hypothetical protein
LPELPELAKADYPGVAAELIVPSPREPVPESVLAAQR